MSIRDVVAIRDFRLLLMGQGLSWVGDAFNPIALSVAVVISGGGARELGTILASAVVARLVCTLLGGVFSDVYARQGFAARELVTRWATIAGPDIARVAEPLKIQWSPPVDGQPQKPATLVLRVEGPMALEIQHMSDVILQRVNRFLGCNAVGKLALRQAPLSQPPARKSPKAPNATVVARVAETLGPIEDDDLRAALARLGAAIKRN